MDSVKYLGCLLQFYIHYTIEVNSDILPFICPQFYGHYTTDVNCFVFIQVLPLSQCMCQCVLPEKKCIHTPYLPPQKGICKYEGEGSHKSKSSY